MTSSPIKKKLSKLELQMEMKLDEIRESYSHKGNRGYGAEQIVRDFLREFLPPMNRIGHGEVIDSFGGCSLQTDVVITNEYHPYLNALFSPSIFFLEGVACVGEVKSILSSNELEKVFDNCEKFKNLKMNLPPKIKVIAPQSDAERFVKSRAYFLFAFETQLSFETIFQRLSKQYNDNIPMHKQLVP